MPTLIDPHALRTPQDLLVTPTHPRRLLVVGSCLAGDWTRRMKALPNPCESDIYLVGRELPAQPDRPVADYDFQLVQLGLRFVLPDASFGRLNQNDIAGHEKLFAHAVNSMHAMLDDAMRWNREHGILTFVFPFVTPVQNAVGRLLPRYDLRNPVYFVEKLNEALAGRVQGYVNAHFFDFNEVLASFGKIFAQEDAYTAINHGGFLGNWDHKFDRDRLEPAGKATDFFPTRVPMVFHATWQELVAMWRSIRQIDMVKLVVFDLDDTLWRGVTAEIGEGALPTTEGWPKGLWEALTFLKRRGVLLAIISKNDEDRVHHVWRTIFGRQLKPEDFAILRIDWRPKPENMAEILAHLNLLPRNVVYVDDNPVERAAIQAAFPAIRVLGGTPLLWRRILLWSAETQVPSITAESAARTDMARAQVTRETQRQAMSREDFLASLNVRMKMFRIGTIDDPRFPRVLELINKTNQFNTTGKRLTREECQAALAAGAEIHAFDVADTYTEYGLVGVLVVESSCIRQFVMSCRVMGLGVETAAVARIGQILHARGNWPIQAVIVNTERNLPCRDVYERCGFTLNGAIWQYASADLPSTPAHITMHDVHSQASLTQAAE
jgi:FkbH-like protein